MSWPFYVYDVMLNGEVVYVGKGVRSRGATSKRHRGGDSWKEVARFHSERDAFAFEVERIAALQPKLNRHRGGNGGRVGMQGGVGKRVNVPMLRMNWNPTPEESRIEVAKYLISKFGLYDERIWHVANGDFSKCKVGAST